MSKKRGLSLEEKREKMLQIFYESQDFFLLKELEKKGPSKGVISQSVKDVIQSLVDDDLACKEKIGTSIYFWALPSQAGNQLRQARKKSEDEIELAKFRREELEIKLMMLKKQRADPVDREERMKCLRSLEAQNLKLKEELEHHAENDPEVLDKKRKAADVAHEAVNRWTDNIFSLQHWCNRNHPEAKEHLLNMYSEAGITEDLDYAEE